MSSHHCYLCASDEGILLDIFADSGKTHCVKIEICLSVKIRRSDVPSAKICHKCAYELDACSKFVQKYRNTRDARKATNKRSKGHCSLCQEPGIKGYIFQLGEGSPLQKSLRKIRELFDDDFFKDQPGNLSICLNCRYNLDVLFDLKSVYQSTLDKLKSGSKQGTNTSVYPKTRTSVVSRKTTYIPLPQLNSDKAYETDSSTSTVMPMRRKRGRPRKNSATVTILRICEQCDTAVENGIDMYRYHRTGRTVCKDCWLTMDPEKVANNKRRKLGLVLKDVLSNPSKYKSIYKVERDEHGNTTFLITDDSSESEEKEKTPVKRARRNLGNIKSPAKEEPTTTTMPDKKKPVKRVGNAKPFDDASEPPTKVMIKGKTKLDGVPSTSGMSKTRNGIFASDSEVMVLRTRRNSAASSEKRAKVISLSDVDSSKPVAKKVGRPRKIPISVSPVSQPKIASTAPTMRGRRAAQKVASAVEKTDEAARPARRTRTNSVTNQDATSLASRLTSLPVRNSKSLSESGSPPSKSRNSKTKSLSPKNAKSDTETESSYSCSICKIAYRNKLIGMAHELTHAKQPEVKLQRVTIPEIIVEEPSADISLIEEPEEQSHDVSSTSDHRSENAECDEKPAADVSIDTESIPIDTKIDEDKGKVKDSEVVPIVEEQTVEDNEKKENEDNEERNIGKEDNVEANQKDVNEDETDTPVVLEPETSEENKKDDESNVDKVSDAETKETPVVSETDKITDDKVTEETPTEEKTESTHSEVAEQKEKEVELVNSVEEPAEEETLKKSTETPVKENGVNAKHDADTEVNEVEEVEKTVSELDTEADFRVVDACRPEESIEHNSSSIPPVTSETPKKDNKNVNPVKNDEAANDAEAANDDEAANDGKATKDDDTAAQTEETDAKSLETTLETKPTEAPIVEEDVQLVVRKESESISVVTEVLREVFDLATAEVQKRLDIERPNDEKCPAPVAETLENISLEIQNSADMPSLEPLVEDQSSKNQS